MLHLVDGLGIKLIIILLYVNKKSIHYNDDGMLIPDENGFMLPMFFRFILIPNSQEVIILKKLVHILPCLLYLMLLLILQFLEMIKPFLWAILPPESFLYSELLFFFRVSYFFVLLVKKLLDKITCHFQFKVHYFLFVF